MTLKVALEALHSDANAWSGIADTTETAARATDSLCLGESDLSFASAYTGVLGQYEAVRAKAKQLLSQATSACDGMSNALESAASAYEISDEYGSSRLKGVWDPKR